MEPTEDKSNEDRIMRQLKQTLLDYIQSNEKVQAKYSLLLEKSNMTTRRLFVLVVAQALTFLCGLSIIIYLVSQPTSATGVAMKQVQELTDSVIRQRKFIEADRQDIAAARRQVMEMMKMQDSVARKQDSAWNAHYMNPRK